MTIYFIEMENENKIKIGYTAKEAKRRMKELQTGQPNKLILIGTIPGEKDGEAGLHKEFSDIRSNGEWFEGDLELRTAVSFLIQHQHPWYFVRARAKVSKVWAEAFSLKEETDRSAYDDQVEPTVNHVVYRRINVRRKTYGIDPKWERQFKNKSRIGFPLIRISRHGTKWPSWHAK